MAHPYMPANLELPGYAQPLWSMESILSVFFGSSAVLIALGWTMSGGHKHLGTTERMMLCWFLCCGFIHFVFEGTVVAFPKFFQDASGNILFDLWKEYSKADSRYLTRDDFVISMEFCTAFVEGPACILIVWALLARKPWRYNAITLVSLGQLYGDVLYFGTCIHGGVDRHSRPEFLYFWFYFVIVNGIWIVVPLLCIVYACTRISSAVSAVEGKQATNRNAKKSS